MKLQYKIALMVFGFGTLFIVGISSLSYRYKRLDYMNRLRAELSSQAGERADHVHVDLINKAKVVEALSSVPAIEEALNLGNSAFAAMRPDEREREIKALNERWMKTADHAHPFIQSYMTGPVAAFLKETMARNPGEYGEIFLTNRYGTIVATTGKLTTLAHAHKYWWKAAFNEGKGRVFFDDRSFDTSVEGYVLGVVVPVMKKGEIIGILKCNVNMEDILQETVEKFKRRKSGSLKIARSGGLIVLEKGKAPLSTRAPSYLLDRMKKRGTGSIINGGREAPLVVAYSPISITSGLAEYGFGGKYESIDHIMGNRGELWYVLLSQEMNEALFALREEMRRDIITGLIFILVMGFFSIFIGRRLALPVMRMAEMARRVGAGNFDVEMDVSSHDELGSLARSFNDMTHNLRERTTSIDNLSREVAERRKAEEKLHSIFLAAGEGIIVATAASRIIIVNEDLCRTFGYLEEELIEKNVEMLMPEKYRKDHTEGMKRYMESGAAKVLGRRIELEGLRKDGTVFPLELRIEETGESKREEKVFVAAIRDITNRKRNEYELKRYASDLEESNRIKDLFSDIMSHDLMNPANAIRNASEFLYEKESDEQNKEIMELVRGESQKIIELIGNASAYSRLQHLEELDRGMIELSGLLWGIIQNFDFDLKEKAMEVRFEPGKEYLLEANKMIREVFLNLISNAIKYGSEKSAIEISLGYEKGKRLVSVKNYGEGIPDEEKEKVFERFQRVGKTAIKGTGLGLAIAKRIVELHHGSIWVEDNPEGGSIFYVSLPGSPLSGEK
ncbi:MAG: ATP-binding protein [Deltaproteobacteria bacterium]|nr:ATP-binding protein [Deltaproteobacteria bacterium]